MDKFYISKTDDAQDLPLPSYMTKGASGMDLYANVHDSLIIEGGELSLVPTGIKIALPEGYEAQIRPRSGLALKNRIGLLNSPGTVDCDYRGEIKVVMMNFGDKPFEINRGDRIAQMVISEVAQIKWTQTQDLPDTNRMEGGFGHTGK